MGVRLNGVEKNCKEIDKILFYLINTRTENPYVNSTYVLVTEKYYI